MSVRGTIVLAGSVAQKPGNGGHTWVFLQYLLGLRRLGWDVLLLDELDPDRCIDEAGRRTPLESSWNLRYFRHVMQRFGLAEAFALRARDGDFVAGLRHADVLERVRRAATFINVMGYWRDDEIRNQATQRVFLDIDPGFGQMWRELRLADVFAGHDRFVTIGENIGRPDCTIPTNGLTWITTPQPILLEYWPTVAAPPTAAYTSVASWRGLYGPIEFRGTTYGLRVHEFRKFASLPTRIQREFQLALDIHPSETRDIDLLRQNRWELLEPAVAAGDPWAYRKFVQDSHAEVMVAKNMYVTSNSGWFSDRSICYLASGKPVLAQDTGIRRLYPTGEGLVTFATLEEAQAGAEAIERDYSRHCWAARGIAEDYFDSDKVLTQLLVRLGVA